MENYFTGLGRRIRQVRKQEKLTINALAQRANVSNGLVSKIENGRTIPSLAVLLNLVWALKIDIGEFFQGISLQESLNYVVVRKEQYSVVQKEQYSKGFIYKSIISKHFNSMGLEAVLLEITPFSKRNKIKSDAFEFKYILSGSCSYNIGKETIELNQGDSLFFDGRIAHAPSNQSDQNCLMLVVYFYLPTQDR
ncbi:helix-turn-helix domain-containing protein [Myroides sp. LJL119]